MLAMADEHLRNIAEAEQVLEYDLKQAFKHEREQGTERGIAIGKIEGKIETAQKLYARKMPMADIIDITGLTASQLAEIGIHS
jgi:predicted transposase/invertase (TIGR01784 family)